MARNAKNGDVALQVAGATVFIAAMSNTLVKAGLVAVLAPKSFQKIALPGFAIMLAAAGAGFLFLY